ncbi:MAG TPA: hypothetical protein VK165_09380 [Azonexus sp.]|nr:hypothetical protein [Azonexus sp.]
MQLEIVIQALRERCPSFANRVGGAAEFKQLEESTSLPVPSAFVIPLDDNPKESMSKNSVHQPLTDSFAVIVAVDNTVDERGQAAFHSVRDLRRELWAGLLGWKPDPDYDGINYEGGTLLKMSRARLWYQFEFGADMEIGPEDGWQDIELAGLPHFDQVSFRSDFIDPADPNLQSPGPDGRDELQFTAPKTGVLP